MIVREWHPSYIQVYVWQVPVMLLNFSILAFLTGLAFLVWDAVVAHGFSWASQETRVRFVNDTSSRSSKFRLTSDRLRY